MSDEGVYGALISLGTLVREERMERRACSFEFLIANNNDIATLGFVLNTLYYFVICVLFISYQQNQRRIYQFHLQFIAF